MSSGRLDPRLLQEVGDLNILGSAIASNGTATQVCISLRQEGIRCILAIANDASIIKPTTCERKKGGYGTKMMNA